MSWTTCIYVYTLVFSNVAFVYRDFAVAAGLSPALRQACIDAAEMLEKEKKPETTTEVRGVRGTVQKDTIFSFSDFQCEYD